MRFSRYRCGIAVLNGEIYILGWNRVRWEPLVALLFFSRCWMLCVDWAPPPQVSLCLCAGGIGCEGDDCGQSRRSLSSVEIYNPDQDSWRPGPSLPSALLSLRTCASNLGAVDGRLYLCGYFRGAGKTQRRPTRQPEPKPNQGHLSLCAS